MLGEESQLTAESPVITSTTTLRQSIFSLPSTNSGVSRSSRLNSSAVSFVSRFRFIYPPPARPVAPNTITIKGLVKLIDEYDSLQSGEIISSEGYREHTPTHRFLVLELQRDQKKSIWVRLERRPSSRRGLVRRLGSVLTDDTVRARLAPH